MSVRFPYLLEAQELDDAQVHCRVEAQAALVWADGAIELHAVSPVRLNIALVIEPAPQNFCAC